MGNNNKKQIKIPIIVVILLIIILAGGICLAYFFTDVFKTDKEMFFTYIAQNSELLDFFEDSDLEEYKNKQETTAYSNEGILVMSYGDDTTIGNTSMTFSGETDKSSNYKYQTASLNYSDTDSITVHYINMEDYYGIKIDNILNKYVAVENNNLKEWIEDLGILDDDEIEQIPDKIDFDGYETIDVFTDEEITILKEKYSSLLTENLPEGDFSNSSSDSGKVYTLSTTSLEAVNLLNKFLEEIKNDEIISTAIERTLLQISDCTEDETSEYMEELVEYINKLQENIQDSISDLEEKTIYINAYVDNKELVKTEIILRDTLSLSIENGDDSYSIVLESLDEDDSNDVSIDVDSYLTTETEDATVEDEVSVDENEIESQTYEEDVNETVNETESDTYEADEDEIVNKTEDETESNNEDESIVVTDEETVTSTTSEGIDTDYIKIDLYKSKTNDNLQYLISCSAGEESLFDCTVKYEGIETLGTVEESFNFSVEMAELNYEFTNKKTFGIISKEDITVDDMFFLNTYSDVESVSNMLTQIVERVEALDDTYVTNLGFSTTPGIYYLPAAIPYSGMTALSNRIGMNQINVGVLALALGTTVYEKASETISAVDLSETEIQVFNSKFTNYEGTGLNAANVRSLYFLVTSSNASEETSGRGFIVTINGEIPESAPDTLSSETTYKITLEYSEEGYVSNIIYVDENEEETDSDELVDDTEESGEE